MDGQVNQERVEFTFPLPEEALHGLAGRFVRTYEPYTEADPAALLVQFLQAFGNVIGKYAYMNIGGVKHYGNLYAAIVGNSARARKGTSFAPIQEVFGLAEPEYMKTRRLSGMSSGEGLITAVRDAVYSQEPVKEQGKIVGYQEVMTDEGVDDKRLLVIEGEFGRVLKVMSREGNTLSPLIREAWDGGNLTVMTKTPQKATDAHISIAGHITFEELSRLLSDTDSFNGFANRFLWCYVKRSKYLSEDVEAPVEDVEKLCENLKEAISFGSQYRRVCKDEKAQQDWNQVYRHLETETPGLLGAVIARSSPQVLRLAMLYALLDRSHAIRGEHLRAALALWSYCEASAEFIFGGVQSDPIAARILDALRKATGGMTRTEIGKLFAGHGDKKRIDAVLNSLAEQGKIIRESHDTGGRPTEVWRCVKSEKSDESPNGANPAPEHEEASEPVKPTQPPDNSRPSFTPERAGSGLKYTRKTEQG